MDEPESTDRPTSRIPNVSYCKSFFCLVSAPFIEFSIHCTLSSCISSSLFSLTTADVPLLKRSLELFHELNAYYKKEVRPKYPASDINHPESLLNLCGGVMIGTPQSEVVAGVMRSIKAHNMPHEILSAATMRARFPVFKLNDDEVAVWEDNAGYLQAECCWESYIHMARKHGAELHFEEPMQDWAQAPVNSADSAPCVIVRTAKGVYRAKKLVLSVGAWAPGIFGKAMPVSIPLYIERRVLYWFKPDANMVQGFKVSICERDFE